MDSDMTLQIKYYNYMKLQGFITGDEKKKDKNATC